MSKQEEIYATVDDVITILQKLSADGYGGYVVGCNGEYLLAKKHEIPELDHKRRRVDLGGYA